jgi:hypothetical protein
MREGGINDARPGCDEDEKQRTKGETKVDRKAINKEIVAKKV